MMKAKEYLQRLQRLDTVLNQKIKEQAELRSMSTSIGSIDYSKDKVQTSRSGDAPYTKIICRIVDLDEEINREIEIFMNERHKIINQIQQLSNVKHIDILYKRYVEYKGFEVISSEMNFTYQYVLELHRYALQNFERTYKNL